MYILKVSLVDLLDVDVVECPAHKVAQAALEHGASEWVLRKIGPEVPGPVHFVGNAVGHVGAVEEDGGVGQEVFGHDRVRQ